MMGATTLDEIIAQRAAHPRRRRRRLPRRTAGAKAALMCARGLEHALTTLEAYARLADGQALTPHEAWHALCIARRAVEDGHGMAQTLARVIDALDRAQKQAAAAEERRRALSAAILEVVKAARCSEDDGLADEVLAVLIREEER